MVPIVVPDRAGEVVETIIEYTINPVAVNTGDVVELFALPAMCKLVRADILSANFAAANITIGFMSGTYGDPDAARTVGSEIFNAQAANAAAAASLATLVAIAADENKDRGIGMTVSANQAAAANKKIQLRLAYTR